MEIKATDQRGLKEQSWLLVSVIKQETTKILEQIVRITAKATKEPREVCLWMCALLILRLLSGWREKRVMQRMAVVI